MPFITMYNASRIVRKVDADKLDLTERLYKQQIFFFSKFERAELLAFRLFISNPEHYVNEMYEKLDVKASDQYIFEYDGQKPAYHEIPTCELLNSDFKNMRVPQSIRDAGIDLKVFRKWAYETVYDAFKAGRLDIVQARIELRWGVVVSQSELAHADNSGIMSIENADLGTLESILDRHLRQAAEYFHKHSHILRRFSKLTFLSRSSEAIYSNDTGLSDDQLKAFLKDYHMRFKLPTMRLLKQWYMVKLNPELKFQGLLLEQLNFKACSQCHEDGNKTDGPARHRTWPERPIAPHPFDPLPSSIDDDLPF
jgi:hypothetical protein